MATAPVRPVPAPSSRLTAPTTVEIIDRVRLGEPELLECAGTPAILELVPVDETVRAT